MSSDFTECCIHVALCHTRSTLMSTSEKQGRNLKKNPFKKAGKRKNSKN